jgi:hypothetical protein
VVETGVLFRVATAGELIQTGILSRLCNRGLEYRSYFPSGCLIHALHDDKTGNQVQRGPEGSVPKRSDDPESPEHGHDYEKDE